MCRSPPMVQLVLKSSTAAVWLMVLVLGVQHMVSKQWASGFSGSEGGLDGLSLLRSFGRHRVLRSLTQPGVQGRRCARVQHAAMWLMVSKQW